MEFAKQNLMVQNIFLAYILFHLLSWISEPSVKRTAGKYLHSLLTEIDNFCWKKKSALSLGSLSFHRVVIPFFFSPFLFEFCYIFLNHFLNRYLLHEKSGYIEYLREYDKHLICYLILRRLLWELVRETVMNFKESKVCENWLN